MALINIWKRYLVGVCLLVWAASQTVAARDLPDFTVLAEKYGPAVVNISTTQKTHQATLPKGFKIPDLPEGTPWDDLLRRFFGDQLGNGEGEDLETRSLGSGFIIDKNGYILTNNHVVDDADEVVVRLNDRRELVAEVIGTDKRSDIALLKVDATDLPTVKLGSNKDTKVGEWVMAIGSPFGFEHSVSVGVVSALGRSLPEENYVPFIQTDVAINPGNSGGPLFNLDGEVIGINSQIYSRTGGFMGLSFAIPVDVAKNVIDQLKDRGYVSRGWLGVLIQDVTRELAESFGMDKPSGALVAKVLDDSPAADAGLKVGDVIVEFEGHEIAYSSELPPLVGRTAVNSVASVKVLRDGKLRNIKVKIAELPKEEAISQATGGVPEKLQTNRIGVKVSDLSDEQRKELEVQSNGVLVEDIVHGAAQEAGIRKGDVILKLNHEDVKDSRQFEQLVDALPAGKAVPVLVQRGGNPLFLPLKVPE